MSEIRYNRQNNRIQCVAYSDCEKEYPLHTHTNHIMLGTVNSGNCQNADSSLIVAAILGGTIADTDVLNPSLSC